MYGNEKLNNHNILRYGLTIEFYQNFRSLKYLDIELPLVLIRHFHIFIKPIVNKNLKNQVYIRKLQLKHKIYTMKDVQKALKSGTKIKRDLSKYTHRNTILMSGFFAPFAIDQFPNTNVILMNANHHDSKVIDKTLIGQKLPNNIQLYDFKKEQRKIIISKKVRVSFLRQLQKLLVLNQKHEIFGTLQFQKWIKKNLYQALRWIDTLELLIRKRPIGLILDHVQITYPGNILSLVAVKYNLPFILAPQVLISDRSFIPSRAKQYLVWGNNYRNWINKRGISPSKIKTTGNLRFEYEKKVTSMSKVNFIKKLNIPNNHLIITFTTQPFSGRINSTLINWIKSAMTSLPITVIIKPHPFDKTEYTQFIKLPNIILPPKDMEIYNILENSDFVMTISSTTAIEAAQNKNGIIVLQPKMPYDFEHNCNDFNAFLVKSKAGLVARNSVELRKHFKRLVDDKEFRKSIVNKGQKFLSETINIHVSPSIMTRRIIQNYLKK